MDIFYPMSRGTDDGTAVYVKNIRFSAVFSLLLVIGVFFACRDSEPAEKPAVADSTKSISLTELLIPDYFHLPELSFEKGSGYGGSFSSTARFKGFFSPYSVYMIYQSILPEHGWEIYPVALNDSAYSIYGSHQKLNELQISITAKNKTTHVDIILGFIDD